MICIFWCGPCLVAAPALVVSLAVAEHFGSAAAAALLRCALACFICPTLAKGDADAFLEPLVVGALLFLASGSVGGGVAGMTTAVVLMGAGFCCWMHGFIYVFSPAGGLPNGVYEWACARMYTGIAMFVLGVFLARTNISASSPTYELAREI